MKTQSIESRKALKIELIGPENIVSRRIRAPFSPEILQAVAVKGLMGRRASGVVSASICITMSSGQQDAYSWSK